MAQIITQCWTLKGWKLSTTSHPTTMSKLSCHMKLHDDQNWEKNTRSLICILLLYIHIIVMSRGCTGKRGVILRARFWTSHYANSALTLIVFVIPTIKNVDKRKREGGKTKRWMCERVYVWVNGCCFHIIVNLVRPLFVCIIK